MKRRIVLLCASLLCVLAVKAQVRGNEISVLVSPDRSDWTYESGEKCTFTVRVLKAQNPLQELPSITNWDLRCILPRKKQASA